MYSRLYTILLSILILSETRAIQPFNENTLPQKISKKLDDYWQVFKVTRLKHKIIIKKLNFKIYIFYLLFSKFEIIEGILLENYIHDYYNY